MYGDDAPSMDIIFFLSQTLNNLFIDKCFSVPRAPFEGSAVKHSAGIL